MMMIVHTSITNNSINIMLHIIFMIMLNQIQNVITSDNMLFIRHGRSRVRHSNEKDHIRWGLQAFDNLTLDYDIDDFDNDTINGNITQNINTSSTLFGSDIWALTTDNTSYLNQTTQLYSTQQKSRGFQSSTFMDIKKIQPSSSSSLIISSQPSGTITSILTSTQFPLYYPITTRKKLRKKKIMENIKKNVDKGLEYLKSHQNLDEDNIKIPTSIIKYDDDYIQQHHQEFGYQNDAIPPGAAGGSNNDGGSDSILIEQQQQQHLYKFTNVNEEKILKNINENNWKNNIKENIMNEETTSVIKSINNILNNRNNDNIKNISHKNYHQQKHFQNNEIKLNRFNNNKSQNPIENIQQSIPQQYNQKLPVYKAIDFDVHQSVIRNSQYPEIDKSDGIFENLQQNQENIENDEILLPLEQVKFDEPNQSVNIININNDNNSGGGGGGMGLGTIQNDDSDAGIYNDNRGNNNNEFDDITDNTNNNNDDDTAIIEDELILANIFDGISEEDLSELDEISRNNRLNLMKGRDVVTKFLQIVETQHLLGANCKAGTALNLGEGVVDRYAQDRFRVEAEVAVNRANMLTSIFKNTSPAVQYSEHLLHASVLSMVAFDDDIFAAGHCFDWDQHPLKSGLFCPFAYRLPSPDQGASFAKDLAAEYDYLGNTSEWFFQARKNAERVIARNDQYIKAFHLYINRTDREEDEILAVKYEDGRWSKPYYDCGGGNIWMLTYTVPFFGYDNENTTYFFKGTSGIDIDLRRVDIDQCPQRNTPGTTQPLNIFAGTDKCKQRTTMCEPIPGLGFRRGSYKCICRKGFYYPDTISSQKYFNGSILEEEYEKLMLGENSTYNKRLIYECLPCAEGCDYCEDASPCVAALNWPMRTSILVLACAVIGFLPPAAWFTFRYQQVKVVRAASPALLRVIALGAFFIYCTTIVMYPHPSLYTCTARIWLREIGFSLTYGALMLKTWRISVIFRVRSAKAVKITDAALLKRLGVICGVIGGCLLVRTIVSPPEVVVGRTADDLKAFLCKTDWWDYTFTSMEVLFLAWGVRLCIMVRKAPSEFNESRFISMAIYNEFLLTCFLNVSMLFLQSPANPDLLFIIFFCHTQLTVTLLLGLIFGSKVYIVLRSGKSQETISMGAKSSGAKFNFRPQIRTFANPSTSTSTAQMHTADTKLSDQEALEEIRQLSVQLQRIQESAPPKGIAVMTIATLLDGLKMTTQQFTLKPPIQTTGGISSSGLTLIQNNDIQKLNYHQQQQQQQQQQIKNNNHDLIIKTKLEKSINTSLTGDEFLNKLIYCENTNNIITNVCQNCAQIILLKSCHDKQQKSNEEKLIKNNLSFSNLQLDCMCSQSDDLDDDHQQIQQLSSTNQIENNNCHNSFNNNNNNNNNNNINQSNLILCTNTIKNYTIPINTVDGEKYDSGDNGCIKINSPLLIQSKQSSIRSRKHKCHSSNNLLQLQQQLSLNEQHQQHEIVGTKSILHSSSCDNHKFNKDILICDNCNSKLIYTTTTISGTNNAIEPTFSTFKPPSQQQQQQCSHSKSNKFTGNNKKLITTNSESNLDSNLRLKSNIDIDELSFHSTDDSSCYNDDKKFTKINKICDNLIENKMKTNNDDNNCFGDDQNQINNDIRLNKIDLETLNIDSGNICSGNSSKHGSGNDIADEYSSSSSTTGGGNNSTDGGRKIKHRKNDKLLLDLNDRSKYTKEVSV